MGEEAAEIIERLGIPIDEGSGLASRVTSYGQYVQQSIRFEGFEGNPKLQGDLVIGASTIARDAALWTLDQRSLTALGQLGVRFWSPPGG